MMEMVVTDSGQGFLLVSLSRVIRTVTISAEIRARLVKCLGNDAMSRALNQISRSPFTCRIEGGKLPRWFTQPTFTMYNGRTDPIEHVSHFNQRMAVHSKNEALMCKVFLSSLGPMTMRWFDGRGGSSIDSFKELTWAFGSRFVTCS